MIEVIELFVVDGVFCTLNYSVHVEEITLEGDSVVSTNEEKESN